MNFKLRSRTQHTFKKKIKEELSWRYSRSIIVRKILNFFRSIMFNSNISHPNKMKDNNHNNNKKTFLFSSQYFVLFCTTSQILSICLLASVFVCICTSIVRTLIPIRRAHTFCITYIYIVYIWVRQSEEGGVRHTERLVPTFTRHNTFRVDTAWLLQYAQMYLRICFSGNKA